MFSALRNFLITLVISLAIFGLIAYFVVNYGMNTMLTDSTAQKTTETASAGDETGEADGDPGVITGNTAGDTTAPSIDISTLNGTTFTALLIGTDYRPNVMNDYDLSEENANADGFPEPERTIDADSIMIVHVDKETGVCMLSAVPSNMSVTVDGVSVQLKELYESKGVDYLVQKVTAVTGLNYDYYAVVHIQDFITIIDKMGGVEFDIPVSMKYDDMKEGLSIRLNKGSQTLDGQTAAKMLRYRSYSDGNVSRMNLAVNFAKTLITRLTSSQYAAQAVTLYRSFAEYVQTSFKEEDLVANLDLIYALPSFTFTEITYPGTTKVSNGTEYFDPNLSGAINLYKEYRDN